MKSIFSQILLLLLVLRPAFAQLSWQSGSNPEQNQGGTLLFNAVGTPLANASGTLYLHTGVTLNGQAWQNVIGSWGSASQPSLSLVSANLYKLDITPSIQAFYGVSAGSITKLNVVVRNAAGNAQTADLTLNVGSFDMSLGAPQENGTTIVQSAQAVQVQASNTGGAASYALRGPGGSLIDSVPSAETYSFSLTSPQNGRYSLTSRRNGIAITRRFDLILGQTPVQSAMPAGLLDGINYLPGVNDRATLVLNAPGKDFVYVAGNFNNWQPNASHVMRKDPASGKFWLEINGLTAGDWYAFQYWVCDNTPATNSPRVVKTADPFSTLVLSSFDDPEIVSLGVYPGLPVFNSIAPGQEREVSVIQTGPNAYWNYNWTSTTKVNANLNRKDLVIYEALVRDFNSRRSYQDLIDKIDYFKNLKVNAIQLMPVMEFEGNLSWGYNPVYHMAPDKRYGAPAKLKEFIDLCHQNGIAVILDIALNHVFGRSPLERMWMLDTDGDGWSNGISPDNPYCNVVPLHTLNVGSDLNHFREPENLTNTYVQRTLQEWIMNYRIDGFRWDLTQGFTNACTANDGGCTGSYQTDRVTKLKWYSDMQWSMDPNFYVIFEHWVPAEIPEYRNYRLGESPAKGIMCWSRGDYESAGLLKGQNPSLTPWVEGTTHRLQANMESHDEERILFKAVNEAGQTNGNLNRALARMPALGSIFFLVPGPKMIWHFAELGWNLTQNTCSNGSVNNNCRLDTKPQPQWTQNWMNVPARRRIYDEWSKMIGLRTQQNVFENGQFAFNLSVAGRPRLDVWTSTQPSSSLSYVMVHANFSTTSNTFQAFFPYTGTWYNLMDNSVLNVTSTTMDITLEADGGYAVYGNQPNPLVSVLPVSNSLNLRLVNPASDKQVYFQVPESTAKEVVLRSVEGRELLRQSLPAVADGEWQSVSCPFPAGMYLFEVRTQDGVQVQRLVLGE